METLLGIDVGTTAAKALLLDLNGTIVSQGSYEYEVVRVGEYGYEQEPEELWNGVVACCKQVLAEVSGHNKTIALSLSTQAGTTIPVDEDGNPLCRAISWMDYRGNAYMDRIKIPI